MRHLRNPTLPTGVCCQLDDVVGLMMPIACSLWYNLPRRVENGGPSNKRKLTAKTAQSTRKEVKTPVPFRPRFTSASSVDFLVSVSNIRVSETRSQVLMVRLGRKIEATWSLRRSRIILTTQEATLHRRHRLSKVRST